jgi:DNA-binding response OmpR family regulator
MGATVLIVEDDHSMAQLLKERFADAGYQVQIACTAAEAARALQQSLPDIITLDICLPDADGLRLLEEIKADQLTKLIPVVAISSSDEQRRAKDLGAAAFFPKPVNFKQLFRLVECLAESEPARGAPKVLKTAGKTALLCI